MKPTSPRAARRLAQKQTRAGALSISDLADRVAKARLKGMSDVIETRAKRILTSYLQTAQNYGCLLYTSPSPRDRG